MQDCETNDCRKEKMGCKGCYYEKSFIEQIIDKVQEKIIDYEFKYGNKPKYVRLPLWCAVEVTKHGIINREHLKPKSEGKILLLNLEMCEDRNIYKIEEIEVF